MFVTDIGKECWDIGKWDEFVKRTTKIVPLKFKYDDEMKKKKLKPEIYSLDGKKNVVFLNNLNVEGKLIF